MEKSFKEDLEGAREILRNYIMQQRVLPDAVERCLDAVTLATTWYVEPSSIEEMKQGEAFIASACGIGKRKDGGEETLPSEQIQYNSDIYYPGRNNEEIAKLIAELHQDIDKPIFAQWEIASALEENHGIKPYFVAKPQGVYLGIGGVITQFLEAGLKDLEKIILVVNHDDIIRVRATANKEAIKKRGRSFEKIYVADTYDIEYDPESLQPWTRNETLHKSYEIGWRIQNIFHKKTFTLEEFFGKK